MTTQQKRFLFPVILLTIGAGHLLNVQGFIPQVDWLWTGLLGVAGLLILIIGSRNKMTFTIGPWLIVVSICSFLRETGRLEMKTEVPILVISLGAFLLISELMKLPTPDYLKNPNKDDE